MKKFLILILFFSFCLSGCSNNNSVNTQETNNNYSVSRALTTDNTTNVNTTNTSENNKINNTNTETEIASFSTKIYTPNDKARQNNIKLTCSNLNETIVKSRRNLFFLRYCRKSYS